jgi:hypothetical protein
MDERSKCINKQFITSTISGNLSNSNNLNNCPESIIIKSSELKLAAQIDSNEQMSISL